MNRRRLLKSIPASVAMTAMGSGLLANAQTPSSSSPPAAKHFKQGFTRQVFGAKVSTEDCCRQAVQIGFTGFDLADDPADWPILKKYGILQSMYRVEPPPPSAPLPRGAHYGGPPGWNAIGLKEAQGDFLKAYHEGIDTAAANGFPQMLLQAGALSATLTSEQGADNTVEFCNQVKSHAEDKGITLCMEILNSKGIQAPLMSMFDHMSWGVDVMKRVNSPHVKILYDVFHAQLVEGDLTQTIRDNIQYIGHIHTGGVPGRHQIDETQEVNYQFLAHAIADLGYTGYVTHEWSPAPGSDPFATASKVFALMNV